MDTYRILITGSRDYADYNHAHNVLIWAINNIRTLHPHIANRNIVVVHGGARGADTIVAEAAHRLGCATEKHVPDWERDKKSAGFIRNSHMISLGADIVLAFAQGPSPGTRHCMKEAEKAGLRVINVTETGTA